MALSRAQLTVELGTLLELDPASGSALETTFWRALNDAGRELTSKRLWPERFATETLSLSAPYSVGSAAVTNAGTTVTGTGTTWTAAMGTQGRKFAIGYGSPFYLFTRDTDTQLTLARAYLEETDAETDYVIYRDEYDLAAASMGLVSAYLLDGSGGAIIGTLDVLHEAAALIQHSDGPPTHCSLVPRTTAATNRVRFSPTPDDDYAARITYVKAWTDLAADGDTHILDPVRERLLIQKAALFLRPVSHKKDIGVTDASWELAVALNWAQTRPIVAPVIRKAPFDHPLAPTPFFTYGISGLVE